MATLVFSTVGTALGGPLGGALGALIGNQLDKAIVGSTKRHGPRLKELAVTTSSYGTAIPRHFGRVRAPGTVIWSTDLLESNEKVGGAKGSPSTTTYAYSVSFAVALASRPIVSIGRIWADGNLLRGAAGDLKVGGQFRAYYGHGDQDPDPLIASDRGTSCPAFRNTAYCVFEDLQLADFGNRIPSLTFEIFADDNEIRLLDLVEAIGSDISVTRALPGLLGFSDEGGPLSASLETIDQLYPTICDGSANGLILAPGDTVPAVAQPLPEAVVDMQGDSFGGLSGHLTRRQSDQDQAPEGLRYYDIDRDFQAGLQRSDGRAQTGRNRVLEFPGVLQADVARQLCSSFVQRAGWSSDQLMWRVAEVDRSLEPGQIVSVPSHLGRWRIESWEWRSSGVEFDLRRLPPGGAKSTPTDPGASLAPRDALATPTVLAALELPWDGSGLESDRQIYAAASSSGNGWTGAALYAVDGTSLVYLQPSGTRRSVVGRLVSSLGLSSATLIDRSATFEVQLASDTLQIQSASLREFAGGNNRALVGSEIIQFADAQSLGSGRWQLTGLLRGRGGTEAAAQAGHPPGEAFVLLDNALVLLGTDQNAIPGMQEIAAIGIADIAPVLAPIVNLGIGNRPLSPVHPRVRKLTDGSWQLSWARRARGAWTWPAATDVPLNENSETYLVGVGGIEAPAIYWQTSFPGYSVPSAVVTQLRSEHFGADLWVRQLGTHASSDPVLLCKVE